MLQSEIKVELESKGCPLGCPSGDDLVLAGKDRLHGLPGEFSVVKCRTCGLMRTNPRPTPESIGFYYPKDYTPYLGTKVETSDVRKLALWKRIVKKFITLNDTRVPTISPGRMLEIGCASGAYMHRMALNGWKVEGIEFSPDAAANARALGYPVHAGSLETAPEPNQPYDLIVGWMVLEHLHEPILALEKLRRWIRPGGRLVLSVPNAASWEFRLFKQRWYALQLPTHLTHFTPKTIRMVLTRSGWKTEQIMHQQNLGNLIASLGYCLEDLGASPGLVDKFVRFPEKLGWGHYVLFPLATLAGWFGQTGRMTIWARSPE